MNCETFRKILKDYDAMDVEIDIFFEAHDHYHACSGCREYLKQKSEQEIHEDLMSLNFLNN